MKDKKKKKNNRLPPSELALFKKRREVLAQRAVVWLQQQNIFMPSIAAYRASHDMSITSTNQSLDEEAGADEDENEDEDEDEDEDEADPISESTALLGFKAEDLDLLLPSSPVCMACSLATPHLQQIESCLRIGRIEVHLSDIRLLLRIKSAAMKDKKSHSVGQKAGTRANKLISDYSMKIERTRLYYNVERSIALRLDPDGAWKDRLKELKKEDVRPVNANADYGSEATGGNSSVDRVWNESKRSISWIWKVPRAEGEVLTSDNDLVALEAQKSDEGEYSHIYACLCKLTDVLALQVEWAKTFARVNRFKEEKELVLEEMRRVRRYFTWKSNWWRERRFLGTDNVSLSIKSGREAYAMKQANIIDDLESKFTKQWLTSLSVLGLPEFLLKLEEM